MIVLDRTLRAWGTPVFDDVLKQQLLQLSIDQLPLQQGMSMGSYVIDAPITLVNIRAAEMNDVIRVQAGVFFQTVIAGCSCADDPSAVNENNEYCEVQLDIDKTTAVANVTLAD